MSQPWGVRISGDDTTLHGWLRARGWDLVCDDAARAKPLGHDDTKSVMDINWLYWKYVNQASPNGIALHSWLGHALFIHFRYNFLEPAKIDLRPGRLDLLAMDFLALTYSPYRDFRLWMNTRTHPLSQRS